MSKLIEPRTLKGFRDHPPELMIPREALMDTARRVFRSYGFAPIDTPALEYAEVLLGKLDADAEIHRQIYRFKDHGDRDVALRFDLTVPLARFVAQHAGKLGMPFKRYHIGPVWRGENTQAGRYREFAQCDFDTIGTAANAADVETALVIHDLMAALGFERFEIRLNNRLILNGLLQSVGLADKTGPFLRALDKLAKQGRDAVSAEMTGESVGLSGEDAGRMLDLLGGNAGNDDTLHRLRTDYAGVESVAAGVGRLSELLAVAARLGLPAERFRVDLSICRGLDYYTGAVYETFLTDLPKIGSVCSGGRYDNLAGLYTKQYLPGVGASLGLDRLLAAMEELQLLPKAATPAAVLIVNLGADHLAEFQAIARDLRQSGIGTEVFPDAKKPGPQFQYAEARGFRVAVTAGADEIASGTVKIRHLATRTETTVARGILASVLQQMLATTPT